MSPKLLNILLIMGSFFLYYVFIGPLYKGTGGVFAFGDGIVTLKDKKVEYDAALVEAGKILSDAQKKRDDYAKITPEDKAAMEIMLPRSVDKIRLLHEMSALSVSTGIPFSDLTASDGQMQGEGKGSMAVSFSTKTTYPKFKELMNVIEKSKRLFSIKNISFSAPEGESGLINFSVKLETYYLQ